jgi:hypothetical protein
MADEESSVWLDVQVILPDQVAQRRVLGPERRLMLAVLHEAVLGYLTGAERTTRGTLREIEEWFMSDDTRWPYSFANLCDGLGLDRSAVRRALFLQRLERLAS